MSSDPLRVSCQMLRRYARGGVPHWRMALHLRVTGTVNDPTYPVADLNSPVWVAYPTRPPPDPTAKSLAQLAAFEGFLRQVLQRAEPSTPLPPPPLSTPEQKATAAAVAAVAVREIVFERSSSRPAAPPSRRQWCASLRACSPPRRMRLRRS